MFADYVNQTWIIPCKEIFFKAWTNKVMHLENTTTSRIEFAHWALERLLQNSLRDLCSVWKAMNNMITLQHTEIKASFETSAHVVRHVFKVILYKRLCGMISRYALNQIATEFERVHYVGKNPSRCGCVMRTTQGVPCACELFKYVVDTLMQICNMQVTMDKWMNIIDMGYIIASRYNVILVSLSLQQSIKFFPLRSQPPTNSFVYCVICIGHVYDNHFVQIDS
ncbi:hypothetical protein GmHk_02G004736 [Glycine max]|nr:hypothetical protein GmHk_02G004736 [Glycine max]